MLLLAASCAPWQADTVAPLSLRLPAELAAAIVANTCRTGFPGADGSPLASCLAHRQPGGFEVRIYVDGDGLWRTSGDTRLRLAWASDATEPTAMAWPAVSAHPAPATIAPAGRAGEFVVTITATASGCVLRTRRRGSIRADAALAELHATLTLAHQVGEARCRLRDDPGAAAQVRQSLPQDIAAALAAAPQVARPWLASAQFALAAAHLAADAWAEAQVALDAGLDFAPERHGARRARAELARRLAHPETGCRDAEIVAALPGADYAGFAADRTRIASRHDIAADAAAWLAAARALAPTDLVASLAHARRARAQGGDDAAALEVLGELAAQQGQPRLAFELQLAIAMQRPLTSAMRLAFARALLRAGDARGAAHWVGEAWGQPDTGDAGDEAGALLAEVRAALGPEATTRAIATSGPLGLASELALGWCNQAGRALLAHRYGRSESVDSPATPGR
jgi:hypothetical protein